MSFQKLFKKADEVSGIARPFPLEQADTSVFDEVEEEEPISRVIVADRDVEKLHSTIKRVVIEPIHDSVIIKRISNQNNIIKNEKICSIDEPQQSMLPDISWDNEIQEMMRNDSSDENSGNESISNKNNNKLNTNINSLATSLKQYVSIVTTSKNNINNIESYNCLDNDNCMDGDMDPLDILIPNPTKDSYMNILPKETIHENNHENNNLNNTNLTTTTINTEKNNNNNTTTTTTSNNDDDNNIDNNIYISKSERDKQRKLEKANRIKNVDINFDAAASIERSALLIKPKDHIPFYRNKLNRSLISSFNHNNIAIQHKNTKADLYEVELKYFHRPRMIRDREKKWNIIPKINKSKLKQSLYNTSSSTINNTTSSSNRNNIEQDKQNLNLSSNNADFILVEYIEEIPPVILNYGMASAIFNYYRYNNKEDDEENNNSTNNSNNNDTNNTTTNNTTTVTNTTTTTNNKNNQQTELIKYRENILNNKNISRLPRHLLLLLQLNKYNKQIYNHSINIPKLKQGETKLLNMNENSPFLGTLEEGEIQQSFINNLFRAPIFKHTISKTDFLLIKIKNNSNILTYILKEIPIIYLCGQIEPLKIVPKPVSMITSLQEKFYILTALRYLNIHFDGILYNDIEKNILKYCLKERNTPHKIQHRLKLKTIIKKITDEIKDNNVIKYYPKDFTITNNNNNNSNSNNYYNNTSSNNNDIYDIERYYNIDEIVRTFTPEDICLQESCNAAEYRLFQQYITDIDINKIENYLLYIYNIKKIELNFIEKIKKIIHENKNNNILINILNNFLLILIKKINKLNQKLEVGRFIFNRLITAPWNTTEAYVHSHLEKDGQGKMQLQGIADPSGIGEGYSFIRIIKQLRNNNINNKKNTTKYYDTDKDLRKLTKKDAVKLLVALGVRENEAIALKRWDRIHMIREFSTKLEKTGLAKELHKYARNNQNDTQSTSTNENFHEIAQDIWNRQKKSLSNTNIIYNNTTTTNAIDTIHNTTTTMEIDTTTTAPTTTANNNEVEQEEVESSDDEDFATSIAKTLARRAAATANREDKLASRRDNREEEKNELNNISSFFQTLDNNSSSGVGGITSNSSGVVRISKTGENAGAMKRPRVHVDITSGSSSSSGGGVNTTTSIENSNYINSSSGIVGGDEEAEYVENRLGFTLSLPITQQQQPTSSTTTTENIEKLKKEWIRPKRVVKRTVRTILADGTEHYHIEFIFDHNEVSRVDRLTAKWRKEREIRRTATAAGGYNTTSSSGSNNQEELEDCDDIIPTTTTSMNINLSRMKKSIAQNNIIVKRNNTENEDDYYDNHHINKKTSKSSKRTHEIIINNRVPRVSLAAKLEEEFIKLWNSKYSIVFRNPVNSIEAPGYYLRITEPICLLEIREKIVSYEYENSNEFVADIEKMVKNSEIYNGITHPVTVAGKKLVNMLHINIHHDREYLGIEHDNINYIEEAIKRKKNYLRKNHLTAKEFNPLIQNNK